MEHRILKRYPLGNTHRIWKQDNFILSTFSAKGENMRDVIENCKEAGFNLLELGWASHSQAEEAIRLCEELEIDLLFQDFTVHGGMQERYLDRVFTEEDARSLMNHLRPWKHTIGVYVWDEPYVEDQLEEARRQMDMFQKEDPSCLPFVVAIPSYNVKYTWHNGEFAAYLRRYVEKLDPPVLSLDYYPIGLHHYSDEQQLDDSWFWCDLALMRKLGREYKLPLWFYYQGVNLYKYHRFIFPMTRMMMYAAAMYGVKGLQQYTASGSTINEAGGKGEFFAEQKQIHSEFAHLGNTLMALENKFVFHSGEIAEKVYHYAEFVDDIADSAVLTGTLPARTSVGELEDAYGNLYLLILNRDFDRPSSVELSLKEASRIYEVSRETGRQAVIAEDTESIRAELAPGDAVLYRVQKASEEAFTIEYRLEK